MENRRDTLPFLYLIPNMVTILGLCAGLTAIRYSFDERYALAAGLIVFAAVIDGFDGLIARRLRATSNFGAELDSLSDFLCFGVAPALVTFRFAMEADSSSAWVLSLLFAICACLRLARFNVMRVAPDAPRHFIGVPAPAGAGLALLPIFASYAGVMDLSDSPMIVAAWLGFCGFLLISRIPTPSFKGLRIARDKVVYVMILAVLLIGLALTAFWLLMVGLGLIYLVVVLVQGVRHRRF